MRRRAFLGTLGALAVHAQTNSSKSRFKQSAMLVNFPGMSLDDACRHAARAGCQGFDLALPTDWPILKKYGLTPTLYHEPHMTFEDGMIHPEIHDALAKSQHEAIDVSAANGCPNIILVGGQKRGMTVEQGIDHTVALLNRLKTHAEDAGVNLVLEPVNGADRPDQLFDQLEITWTICERVDSPRVKILFDMYHAARIDGTGNLVQRIRDYYPRIAHFHTAGVPGRHEIDETQELTYRSLARTIADLGYTGYIAHEYRPSPGRDPVRDLEQAVQIMSL